MNRFPQAVFLWACLAGIAFGQTNDSSADSSTANSPSTPLSSTEKNKREVAFLGISVGGNVNDVVAKLVNKGFVKNETKGNVTALKGVFLDQDCGIFVVCTPITKLVWKVSVTFPERTSWYRLKDEFQERCKNLTAKYGQPHDTYEFFSDPYKEGDGYEMQALENEKCVFAYAWNLSNGSITCEMAKGGYIRIAYENTANSALDDQEKAKTAESQL